MNKNHIPQEITNTQILEAITIIASDLREFKQETRERFDSIDLRLEEIDDSINGIIRDYHPRIIALEEKVFGASALAEI